MSKVYAKLSTFVGHGGQSVFITQGDEYDDSDPLVKAHRDKFTEPAKDDPPKRPLRRG